MYDGHGSTRLLTDSSGTITDRMSYDAYGIMLGGNPTSSAPSATSLLYSGEAFDVDLQQQYLRARYYDQAIGAFNRLDPFGGNIFGPLSLHKYTYSHNDPINGIDPSGLLTLTELTSSISNIMIRVASLGKRILDIKNGAERTIAFVDLLLAIRDFRTNIPSFKNEIQKIIDGISSTTGPKKLKNMSTATLDALLDQMKRDVDDIALLITRKHTRRVTEALVSRKFKKKKRHRLVIYLPTLHGAFKKDPKRKKVPGLKIGGLQADIAFGGKGGRLLGIGFSEPKAPATKTYQLFRLDWHDSAIKHPPPWTKYFPIGNEEFHWHVSESIKEAQGITNKN